jgi:hypothetical protein
MDMIAIACTTLSGNYKVLCSRQSYSQASQVCALKRRAQHPKRNASPSISLPYTLAREPPFPSDAHTAVNSPLKYLPTPAKCGNFPRLDGWPAGATGIAVPPCVESTLQQARVSQASLERIDGEDDPPSRSRPAVV